MEKKNIMIGVMAGIIVLLGAIIISQKKANDLREYAAVHNCTWTYQGTMYGDDRDYICK